jgi:GH15 family glucan-1,4-alpha-glucosidase
MLRSLDAINRPPEKGGLVSNSLVYRYNVKETSDGFEGVEGTFNICTFWLGEALTRAERLDKTRLDEARLVTKPGQVFKPSHAHRPCHAVTASTDSRS